MLIDLDVAASELKLALEVDDRTKIKKLSKNLLVTARHWKKTCESEVEKKRILHNKFSGIVKSLNKVTSQIKDNKLLEVDDI